MEAPIFTLPTEILQAIALETYNASMSDPEPRLKGLNDNMAVYNEEGFEALLRLGQTSRTWRDVAIPAMYAIEARCSSYQQHAMGWAASHGRIAALKAVLAARQNVPSIKYSIDEDIPGFWGSGRSKGSVAILRSGGMALRKPCLLRATHSRPPISGIGMTISKSYANALHVACAGGQSKAAALLIEKGSGIDIGSNAICRCRLASNQSQNPARVTNMSQVAYYTPLHTAMCHGRFDTAMELLRLGASTAVENPPLDVPRGVKNHGETALHTACSAQSIDMVKFIVENKYQTNLDQTDAHGLTPLHYAFAASPSGSIVARYLAENGADIDHRMERGPNMLSNALASGQWTTAIAAIELGADQKKICGIDDMADKCPIQVAMDSECGDFQLEFIQKCVDHGWDPDFKDGDGRSLMFHALTKGCHRKVKTLIQAGASCIVQPDRHGNTPLIVACQDLAAADRDYCCSDKVGMFDAILKAGCHVNHVSSPSNGGPKMTAIGALIAEVRTPQIDHIYTCLRILLTMGADPNSTLSGKPLLLTSFDINGPAFCDRLIRAGATAGRSEIDYMFREALEKDRPDMFAYALELNHKFPKLAEMFRTAIRKGKYRFALAYIMSGLPPASPLMPHPLLEVCNNPDGDRDIKQKLLEAILKRGDVDVNAVNAKGECPLLLVMKSNLSDTLVRELKLKGANINLQPLSSQPSPLCFAVEQNNLAYIRRLVNYKSIKPQESLHSHDLASRYIIHKYFSLPVSCPGRFSSQVFLRLRQLSDPAVLDIDGDSAYSIPLRRASKFISGPWEEFPGLDAAYTRILFHSRREVPWEAKNDEGKCILDYLLSILEFIKKHQERADLDLIRWLEKFFESYPMSSFQHDRVSSTPLSRLLTNRHVYPRREDEEMFLDDHEID